MMRLRIQVVSSNTTSNRPTNDKENTKNNTFELCSGLGKLIYLNKQTNKNETMNNLKKESKSPVATCHSPINNEAI